MDYITEEKSYEPRKGLRVKVTTRTPILTAEERDRRLREAMQKWADLTFPKISELYQSGDIDGANKLAEHYGWSEVIYG